MLTSKTFWTGRHLPMLLPDSDGSAGAQSESKPADVKQDDNKADDLDTIKDLGDAGKEAIRKERAAAKAAVDRAKAAEEERDALKAEKADREAAATKAQEEEAAKKGEFEALAKKREQERDAAKSEATSLKAENDQLRTAIAAVIDAEWKDLPKEVQDAYMGEDDDPIAKLAFLPKGKALAVKLAGKTETKVGNGRDPKSTNSQTRNVEEEARLINRAGNYAM
jgi:hypothetical protein